MHETVIDRILNKPQLYKIAKYSHVKAIIGPIDVKKHKN